MSRQRKSRSTADRAPPAAEQSPATERQNVARRKHPWLLALAATLVAAWIGFLAVMAWRG